MNKYRFSTSTRVVLGVAAALVVASTATAGAAQLVTGKSIKNESITGRDVRNGSLDQGRLLRQPRRPPGTGGPRGSPRTRRAQGPDRRPGRRRRAGCPGSARPQGPQGPAGGLNGLQYVVIGEDVPKTSSAAWSAPCPAGTKVLGGGVSSFNPSVISIQESAPLDDGAGWAVQVHNGGGSTLGIFAWAVCATA